ncbi:YbhN family protein [Candidatus Cloacimonadota bacterium]
MKKRIIFLIQIIATIALFYYIIHKYQLSFNSLSISFINPVWLIFSFYFAAVFIPVMAAFRWKIFLANAGLDLPLDELIKINFESIFWGTFLPSSDGFAYIRIFKIERKYSDFPGKAGSTVIAEKLLGFFILCLLALSFSFYLDLIPIISFVRLIIILILLLITALAIMIFKGIFYERITNILLKSKISAKISIFISNAHDSLIKMPKMNVLISSVPIIIIIQFCTFLNVYILFKVLGYNIPLSHHLAIVPVIQIISLIPFTLSGLGIREGAFVYFYGYLGIEPETAFTVSILNFLILNGIPAIIGGILSLVSQLKTQRVLN